MVLEMVVPVVIFLLIILVILIPIIAIVWWLVKRRIRKNIPAELLQPIEQTREEEYAKKESQELGEGVRRYGEGATTVERGERSMGGQQDGGSRESQIRQGKSVTGFGERGISGGETSSGGERSRESKPTVEARSRESQPIPISTGVEQSIEQPEGIPSLPNADIEQDSSDSGTDKRESKKDWEEFD